jgi:hypothetical protein
MKSKRAGILGSGMTTIISTILIIIILIIFTFLTTTLRALNVNAGISIDEPLDKDINAGGFNHETEDLEGLKSENIKGQLTRKLQEIISSENEDYKLEEILHLLTWENKAYFLEQINLMDIYPVYLEIKKEGVTIICKRSSCDFGQSETEEIIEFLDESKLQHEYVQMELSNVNVTLGNIELEDSWLRKYRYSPTYCSYIGVGGNTC